MKQSARLSGGVAVLVIAVGSLTTSADAQESLPQAQAPAATNTNTSADTASGAPEAAARENSGLAEIIVTAQRRSENVQQVPIAVTAVNAAALANTGINATNDLPQLVPSVQFTRSGPSGLFFVRGVGTTNGATGEEGANAVYVDNVYQPDLTQAVNRFNNIERIEVLKGPQGTLFGRNATGGLIHIITRDPPRSGVEAHAEATYSNYRTPEGKLYLGAALTDTLRADIALVGHHQGEGWGYDPALGRRVGTERYWGARSKIVFEPSDVAKFTLSGDYLRNKDTTTLYYGIASEAIQVGGYGPTPGYDSLVTDPGVGTDNRLYGGSFTGEFKFDFATLTSITAIRRNSTYSTIDVDATPAHVVGLNLHSTSRAFQQEIRLASTSTTPFSWQIGGFYLNGKARNQQVQTGSLFNAIRLSAIDIDAAMKTNSLAGFGEATYDITPTTHLTGGIRYTRDRRTFIGGRTLVFLNGLRVPQGQPTPRLSYGEMSYRASLRQDITDDINAYASFNRGFKAGEYSLQSPADPPVKPQFINAYELGLKSQLFDRRLRVNLAAYHYDISNYQIRSAAVATPGSSQLLNAAKVKVDGFDLEFEAAPTRGLSLYAGFTVLNSRFTKFGGVGALYQAPIIYPNFATTPTTCQPAALGLQDPGILGTGPRIGGIVSCLGDVSGNKTALAPKFTGSLGATYTIDLSDDRSLRMTGLYSYNSGYYFEPDNVVRQGSYSVVNGSVEYRLSKNFGVELWGRNLGNERYAAQKLSSVTGITATYAPPRTYGVTLKADY